MTTEWRSWHYWIILFVALNVLLPQKGNPNPGSRLAAMAAFCESGSFIIDAYVNSPVEWTNDWSRSPNGHFYSNKAPGPMLIGMPLFWLVDQWVVHGVSSPIERFLLRRKSLPLYNRFVSIPLQVIPFAVLTAVLLLRLEKRVGLVATHFAALAVLFGNTASLLMNTYFGHGMAAVWLLGLLLAMEEDRWLWVGMCAGTAALCDYGTLIVLGILPLACLPLRKNAHRLKDLGTGLLLPVIAGGLYHTVCFGRPWRTATQYMSPEFLVVPDHSSTLWGLFNRLPSLQTLSHLVVGSERGILVTQPWLLLTVPAGLFLYGRMKDIRSRDWPAQAILLFTATLTVLLVLNSSYGMWSAGSTIGPRLLCAPIPGLAILAAHVYHHLGRTGRLILWGLLLPSLLLYAIITATTLYVPPGLALWPALCNHLGNGTPQAWMRFSATLAGMGLGIWNICRRGRVV